MARKIPIGFLALYCVSSLKPVLMSKSGFWVSKAAALQCHSKHPMPPY